VYVHRIGRTGRVGREGKAISLVTKREQPKLDAIQKLLGIPIPKWTVPGDEVVAEPVRTAEATEPEVGATVVATVPAGDATGDGEVRRKRRGRRGGRGRRPGGAAATASAE
jgi:superfamily II DNA/RNA helicase